MQIHKVDDLIGGWFIGAFSGAVYHTDSVEVSYKQHYAGEKWPAHYHKIADEINYLISGKMEVGGQMLEGPVIFTISKGEVSAPVFHTDVTLIVVKVPGALNDKYNLDDPTV
jgi:hypothetical protein